MATKSGTKDPKQVTPNCMSNDTSISKKQALLGFLLFDLKYQKYDDRVITIIYSKGHHNVKNFLTLQ